MKILELFSIIFFIGLCQSGTTQTINSIRGQVVDSDGNYQMGNVLVLNGMDSSYVTGDSFLEEEFLIENIHLPVVILKFTSLQFQDTSLIISYKDQADIDLGKIILNDQSYQLDEVTIKGKLPRVQQKANGTIVLNIEKTSLASSNSVEEILSKSPGVIQSDEGIQVIGRTNTIIFLNGKRVDPNQVDLIQPANIKTVEIIRNPSAKYDADGAAVIEIKTLPGIHDGYNVKLMNNFSNSSFFGNNNNSTVSFNLGKNRVSLNGSYELYFGENREILHTTRDRTDAEDFLKTDVTTDWNWNYKPSSKYNLGVHFDMDEDDYFSLSYSGLLEKFDGLHISKNIIQDQSSNNFYQSDNDAKEENDQHSLSGNFYKVLNESGTNMFIGAQYSNILRKRDNDILENRLESDISSERDLLSEYVHGIDIYTAQIDFNHSLTDRHTLEFGSKMGFVNNESTLNFFEIEGINGAVIDPALSNIFNYQEIIAAGYLNYNWLKSESFNMTLGLRSEYTDYSVDLGGPQNLENRFTNFFPYVSLNFSRPSGRNINISYTTSLRRPAYNSLNPVLYYQDAYTSIQGNPDLIPQKSHTIEVVSSFYEVSTKLGYSYTFDPLGARAVRGTGNFDYVLKPVNYTSRSQVYLSLSKSHTWKWLTSNTSLYFTYQDIKESVLDAVRVTPRPYGYIHTNNIINLWDYCNLELLYWYSGDLYEGITHREDWSSFSLTLEKTFMDKAWTCRVIFNDMFMNARPSGYYTVGGTDIFFERDRNSRYIRFSLMYKFGHLKNSSYKNKSSGAQEFGRAQ